MAVELTYQPIILSSLSSFCFFSPSSLSPPSSPLLMAPGGAARPAEPGSSPTAVHSTPPISCDRVASGRAPCPPQRTSAAAPNAQTPSGGRGTRGGGASPRPRQPTWGWRTRQHGAALAGAVWDGAAGAAAGRRHVPAAAVR